MNNFLFRATIFLCLAATSVCVAQSPQKYNLNKMLSDRQLIITPGSSASALSGDRPDAVSCAGIIWLKGVNFSTGNIDVDLRGKDVLQQSFLGIAFHGVDAATYDAIYFRPFNFQSADTLRKMHCVQYISEPDYPWDRLRKEHPMVYENAVTPRPVATAWFHARIEVRKNDIRVYVDRSKVPSLVVKKLNTRASGLIGLWTDKLVLNGDFANLAITPMN